MKILNFSGWILILTSINLNAQHSIYFSGGYGFSSSNELLLVQQNVMDVEFASNPLKVTGVYGTLGKGVRLVCGYGYSFTDQIEFTLDYTRVWGTTFKESSLEFDNNFDPPRQVTSSVSMKAKFWELSPGIKMNFRLHPDTKHQFFLKAGPVIGTGELVQKYYFFTGTYVRYNVNYAKKISVGAQVHVGLEHPLRENFLISFSIGYTARNYTPNESEITSFTVNGTDRLKSLTENLRKTVYKKEFISYSTPDSSRPNEELKSTNPIGNVSLNLGMRFKL